MKELEIKDYIQIIGKRIWWIVSLVVVATVLTGVYSVFIAKPAYEASTKIIVTRSASESADKQINSDEVNTNIRLIDTYKEIIKTPAIMDKVTEQYPEFNLTSEQLIKKVSVNSVNDTQVMTVVVTDQSYKKAAQVVNAVSKVFQDEIPALMNVENVSILNLAKENKVDPEPVSPNVVLNCMIAFVLFLFLSVGLVFLLEFMDDTVKTEDEIQKLLGVPTLALIHRLSPGDMSKESQTSETVIKTSTSTKKMEVLKHE